MKFQFIYISLFIFLNPLFCQFERRQMKAVQINNDIIKVDGFLNNSEWQNAEFSKGFFQKNPDNGEPSTEKTEVGILYDDKNIYIGVKCFYKDINNIYAHQKKRDAALFSDDLFLIIMDTYRDGRTGYMFETNANGLLGDGLVGAGGTWNIEKSWDGIWDVKTSIDEKGWYAEFQIPLSTINYDVQNDKWGINFARKITYLNEWTTWQKLNNNQMTFQSRFAGILYGLSNLKKNNVYEIKPYLNYKVLSSEETNKESISDFGFDFTTNIISGVKGSLTYNTDFAEAEVDQRKVNITRFPLRFPEKRSFFLEGSSVYSFSNKNNQFPFFSRSIGLSDGVQIPIEFGGRISGQINNNEIGIITAKTAPTNETPREDFVVARLKKPIFEESYFGLIHTSRKAYSDSIYKDQKLIGFDLQLFTSKFKNNKNFSFESFFITHDNLKGDINSSFFDLSSRGLRISYPNDIWRISTSYREFGKDYDPSVGFITRNGIKRINPQIKFRPRPNSQIIRQGGTGLWYEYLVNDQNIFLREKYRFTLLEMDFETGDKIEIQYENWREFLDESFEIIDGNIIDVGTYSNDQFVIKLNTAGQRKISAWNTFSNGGFWNGNKLSLSSKIGFKFFPGFDLGTSIEYNSIKLKDGDFNTKVFAAEIGFFPTIKLALLTNIQYDDISEIFSLYQKIRYTIKNGSDLYIVFNYNQLRIDENWDRRSFVNYSRDTSIKINYAYRF